jgi:hypothetical protein
VCRGGCPVDGARCSAEEALRHGRGRSIDRTGRGADKLGVALMRQADPFIVAALCFRENLLLRRGRLWTNRSLLRRCLAEPG